MLKSSFKLKSNNSKNTKYCMNIFLSAFFPPFLVGIILSICYARMYVYIYITQCAFIISNILCKWSWSAMKSKKEALIIFTAPLYKISISSVFDPW